ncbi:MAG TPA: translesion DNA synthesis-associated protein ImuA [Steroidobacteraceae bacterium]
MLDRAKTLEQLARLCRREGTVPPAVYASGCAELDAVLPYGGWQSGTIVELMPTQTGVGEFRLLMPALAQISRTDRHLGLISPPYIPFAPALQAHGIQLERLFVVEATKNTDALWTMEQMLRCKSFGAVVGWPKEIKDRDVRRLQLAAEAGRSIGFLYRPVATASFGSPAAVRLKLSRNETGGLEIDVLKCRGARSGVKLVIDDERTRSSSPTFSLQPSAYSL